MASREYIDYHRVPTDDEDDDDYTQETSCHSCCPVRFPVDGWTAENMDETSGAGSSQGLTQRSNNRFSEIQGSQHRSSERESAGPAPRGGGSLMRWSVSGNAGTSASGNTGASGSGNGSGGNRRRRSDSASGTSTNRSAGRQQSVSRELTRNDVSVIVNGHGDNSGANENGLFYSQKPRRADAIFLANLTLDSFIIPAECLDTFLPAGIPRPLSHNFPTNLAVLEVEDPKQCIVIHLMSHFTPVDPVFESPLANPLALQKRMAAELMIDVSRAKLAVESLVLANMERPAEFPFISFYVINKNQQNPYFCLQELKEMTYNKYDPRITRYSVHHTLDLFTEVATIVRPPLTLGTRRPLTKSTGYIVSVYKVFDGDDGEKFERNWLYWTGARLLYGYLPLSAGLRRITLHKSMSRGDKTYVLLCECSNFLNEMSAVAVLIPSLRGRLCGCTGLYRASAIF